MADLRARIIITADDQSRAGFNSARQGLDQLRQQAEQVRNALLGVLGVSLGAGVVKQLADTADEFKNLQSAIKLSTSNEQEFNRAQTELFDISQRTGTGLRTNVDLFRRVGSAVRDMGGDQERAFNLIELIDKSVALSGVSAETSAAGIEQFNQGLSAGVLRGEEFNSVMLNTPRLAQALADGLQSTKGELRAMAEQGKLTSDIVVKAIESQAATLNTEFQQVPETIGRALVRVSNAWTVFIGKLNDGKGATASIAAGLNSVAENMEALVNAGYALVKIFALVWAGKFVTGITQNTAAVINNAIATRAAAAAQLQLLQAQIRQTQIMVSGSAYLVREAYLKHALATTDFERAVALKAIDAAQKKHNANLAALSSQQALLNQSTRQITLSTLLFGNAVGVVGRAMALLNRAFIVFLAIDIAKTVYEWLNTFDEFRKYTILVSAAVEHLAIIFSYLLSGKILAYWDEMNRKLDESSEKWRQQYFAVGTSVDQQSQKVQQAAEAHTQAWNKVQESIKGLTTVYDDQFARQNEDLKRQLAERLAAIDASDAEEQQKGEQRAQAIAASAQADIDLAKSTADQKLLLIAQTYDAQIQKLGATSARAEALERESIDKRKAIYSELAQHYASIVDKLTQEHDREVQAAKATADTLKQLAIQHQFELNDISRAGAGEQEKIESETYEFEKNLAEAKSELSKGKAADQDRVNSLLERAHELTRDITSSEISLAETDAEVSNARDSAAERLNRLYEEQKQSLEQVQKAHEDNAAILAQKQEEALGKLREVNAEIDKIDEKLTRAYLVNIDVDSTQLDAAIQKLASIPTDKYVTIHTRTVNDGGDQQVGDNSGADTARKNGGPALPGFSDGGFPRRQGRLPGFGGGDKVKALLELGEWIINKNAVRDYGDQTMQAINKGLLPIKIQGGKWVLRRDMPASAAPVAQPVQDGQQPIRRASGGGTGGNWNYYLGRGNYQGYSYVAPITEYHFGLEDTLAALKKMLLLSEKALKGNIEKLNIPLDSPEYAPAFTPNATPQGIRNINTFLNNLAESQIQLLKDQTDRIKKIKISVPAPTLPAFDSNANSATSFKSSETVTLQFKSPAGHTATVFSNKSDVANVLKVLKESGAVTV